MVVSFDHSGDQVEVTFAPRPGNPREPLGKGWMSSFFICDFKLDRERSIWIVTNGFCGNESDVFAGSDEESGAAIDKAVVDLDGYDSKLPVMVWKPKKKSSSSAK